MQHPQKILTDVIIYPIKSTAGLPVTESRVWAEGLACDRRWAIVDKENKIITPREHPRLLAIQTSITQHTLRIMLPGYEPVSVPLAPGGKTLLPVTVFDIPVNGNHLSGADDLLSAYLGIDARLIFMDDDCIRYMKPIHNGNPGDRVSYADSAPLLLTTTTSLDALNARLSNKISMKNFRPNLVVAGCSAQEEEDWKQVQIGEVLFEVSEVCKRCVVTTLDPVTRQRSAQQEPLRTLATYKRHPRGGVGFGINLIPRSGGIIRQGDPVNIIERHAKQMA